MSITDGLRRELRADATVAGLVGKKVWNGVARQDADKPFIIYQRVGFQTQPMLDGVDTLRTITVQVDAYGNNVAEAEAVAGAVRAVLDGKRDTLDSVPIEFCHVQQVQDLSDIEGDEATRRITMTFEIMAHEA